METLTLILLVLAAVLISSIAAKLIPGVSTPLVQIGLGVVWYFTPFLPNVMLDPELFIILFISPLLYLEARNIDRARLAKALGPAISLAVGLVLVTMVATGFLLHAMWPLIPLAAAFALGAALGPTDAVSVAQLSKEASLTDRQFSVLQAESLLNDAASIVGFQTAVAAGLTGVFSAWDFSLEVVTSFLFGSVLGMIVGVIFNFFFLFLRRHGLENMTTRISMELFLPFASYTIAEELGVSGILAVVSTGLVLTYQNRATGGNIARTNLVANSVWQFLEFTLNGSVFVLLGIELAIVMRDSYADPNISLLMLSGIVVLLVIISMALRFLWVAGMLRMTKDRTTHSRRHMSKNRWKSAAIMTAGGPKGAISLALILTLPYAFDSGQPVSIRSSLLFIAAGFITLSLIIANVLLPILAPQTEDQTSTDYLTSKVEVIRRTIVKITKLENATNHAAMRQVLGAYNDRAERAKQAVSPRRTTQTNQLRIHALEWEEKWLSCIADSDTPDSEAAGIILQRLDTSLLRLRGMNKTKLSLANRVTMARTRIRRISLPFFRRLWHALRRKSGRAQVETEDAVRLRDLYTRLYTHTLEQLTEELHGTDYAPEVVSEVMVEYRLSLANLHPELRSGVTFAEYTQQVADLRQASYRLELETIHEMAENDEVTRYQARMLRSAVYLMQADASM